MGVAFGESEWSPEKDARRKASVAYYISIGCNKWKAETLARKNGFKKKHEAFYRAPKQSKRGRYGH